MKYQPKFLSYGKDGTIQSSTTSGGAPNANAAANRAASSGTYDLTDPTVQPPADNNGSWQWDPATKRWIQAGTGGGAAAGGLMGYAGGGVTGNGNLNLNIPLNVGGQGGGIGGIGSTGGTSSVGSTGGNMNPNTGTGGTSTYPGTPPLNHPTDNPFYSGPGAINRTGDIQSTLFTEPAIDYSPFSEEGRRKMAELAARTKGNPTTGPIPGGDYTSANSDMASLAERLGLTGGNTPNPADRGRTWDYANGGMTGYAMGGGLGSLGAYSDGGRLLKGPGDGVSDSIPATIGRNRQPARLADGEFVIPARIVSELGNGSTEAGAKKLYAMMDRVQKARGKTTGKNKVAANPRADKYLPA
jgi:hypothetical protein